MFNKFLSLILTLSLLSSCSTVLVGSRLPASSTDEISYYLSIDKFKYYLNEYSNAFDGKAPDEVINSLRSITVEEIIDMHLDSAELSDAKNYDGMIYDYLKSKGLTKNIKEEDLKWNYNFFRTKLNEAFTLSPSKLTIDLSLNSGEKSLINETLIKSEVLNPNDMTLDSGHYIANRTTRAIFWEAIENERSIEFHLGDSREFLKQLKEQKGEILYEVKPLAKNYNKIFIVKYPDEESYRYAITNIGGQDRLDHLVHQLSLSNLKGGKLTNKVIVKGDLKKFHAAKIEEHTLQLKLLPKADRVIIGQKESIDGKFYIFWKMKALKNLYDEDPDLFNKRLGAVTRDKFFALEKAPFESIFKDKKIIEDAYLQFEKEFEKNPKLIPAKFKVYNYDNFTIEMCDYIFKSTDGKDVRWRVVSNVWGDEIVPIAQAFKNSGHTNVVYMGTAGAFSEKGYKVGDLVIPNSVHDGVQNIPVKSNAMKIEGAKYGGSVEHVGSPFEESEKWLAIARARSELVEVETSYLRKIFNSPGDNVEMYLLISDILGSDSETLAHATSSKRKNMQNKLLANLFLRDSKGLPLPVTDTGLNAIEKNRSFIFDVLSKKSVSYRYYAYSHLKNSPKLTEKEILKFAEENPTFTDSFILDRLVKVSELVHEMNKQLKGKVDFDIAFSKSLVTGTWNPKNQKLQITLKAKNPEAEVAIKTALSSTSDHLSQIKAFAEFSVGTSVKSADMIWMKIPEKTDPDFLVKIYSLAGLKNAGLYQNVTYNGNLTLDLLPISKTEQPLEAFYQGVASIAGKKATSELGGMAGTCIEAMRSLMIMF
ncbi:MAG: hypothetical protein H7281_13220 [Bacteriovorax sp.]|nr:hypothetical protein [Bacteriovorax sp.]